MSVLKNLTVGLLGFLLFVSLTVFGVAFSLNSTVLNPDFISEEINNLNISALIDEFADIRTGPETSPIEDAIIETITQNEPLIKEQAGVAISAAYDYVLGETDDPDINGILKGTFLNSEFVSRFVDNVDISVLAGDVIKEQFIQAIPSEYAYLEDTIGVYIEDAIDSTEPAIKKQLVAVADPIFEYLLMETPVLEAAISLDEIKDSLEESLLDIFLNSPPAELAGIPRNLREPLFDVFFSEFADLLPSTYQLDSSIIDPQFRVTISNGISDTEKALGEMRIYTGYFMTWYTYLQILMALLVVGIIVVLRDVKLISRNLGVPLLIYGALEYAGIWITRIVTGGQMNIPGIPAVVNEQFYAIADNAVRPLETFSLVLLITGLALTVVSFVYKRN